MNLSKYLLLLITILFLSCIKKQATTSFKSVGRVNDGEISFSYEGASGTTSLLNEVMNISPTTLKVLNGSIANCRIKPGTVELPNGFVINPLTCQIFGSSATSISPVTYTIEAISSFGTSHFATVNFKVKALYTFSGVVSGLSTDQEVTISHGTGPGTTITSNGPYTLQSLYEGDEFIMTTTSKNLNVYTCSASINKGVIIGNTANTIDCYPSGNRTLSFSVSGLAVGKEVSINAIFKDSTNTNVISTQNKTVSSLNLGGFTLDSVPINSFFNFTITSVSPGYNCTLAPSVTNQLTSSVSDISISCGTLGPYPINIIISGINTGTISVSNNSTDTLLNKTNGYYTFGIQLNYGQGYSILIDSVPPNHNCVISSPVGAVTGATNINVVCTPFSRTLGGTYSGIDLGETAQIEVSSPGGINIKTLDGITSGAVTSFTFNNSLLHGQSYNVRLISQPAGKICSLLNGSGQVLGNNSALIVSCVSRNLDDCSFGIITPWTGNAAVRALACDEEYLYLGGEFTAIGPSSNGAALISTTVAHPIADSRMPDLIGSGKILGDEDGGWYVVKSNSLIHYKADLSLDSNFYFSIASDLIGDFEIDGDFIFVSTTKPGSTLIKINRFTGIKDPVFNIVNFTVYKNLCKVKVYENFIYLFGTFRINNRPQISLIRFNKETGVSDLSFSTNLYGVGQDKAIFLNIFNDKIYISGDFSQVDNTDRIRFARLNLDGSLDTFNPNTNNVVTSIIKSDSSFFIGGSFTTVAGQSTQKYLARFNLYDDTFMDAGISVNSYVTSMHYDNDAKKLYIAGDFSTAKDRNGEIARKYLAGFNLTNNLLLSLSPDINGKITDIYSVNNKLFLTGEFSYVYSYPINYLARLKLTDGSLDQSFSPNIGGFINSLDLDRATDSLLIGGEFLNAFNVDRSITKLDLLTLSKKDGFSPPMLNGVVTNMIKKNNDIFAIGSFTTVDSVPMKYLTRFDYNLGHKSNTFTDTESNGIIIDIALDNDSVFIGGGFTSIKGNSIDAKYLAALDYNGVLKNSFFNISPTTAVSLLKYHMGKLYVNAEYTDYNGDSIVDKMGKYLIAPNSATLQSSFNPEINYSNSLSWIILNNSSSYYIYGNNIYSLNLMNGAIINYLDNDLIFKKIINVSEKIFIIDNYFRILPLQ